MKKVFKTKQSRKLAGAVFVLFLFPPVGFAMLISLLNKDTKHRRRSGLILLFAGLGLSLLGLPGFVSASEALSGDSQITYIRSVISIIYPVSAGLFFICSGLYFIFREKKDEKLIALICQDRIKSLSDLSVLLPDSEWSLRVRIDRLLSEKRLPGITVVRQNPAPSCADITGKSEPGGQSGNVFRLNALWITAAAVCLSGLSLFLWPVCLILIMIAFILERKHPPRDCRTILISALVTFGAAVYILFTFGLFTYYQYPYSRDGPLLFQLYLPAVPLSSIQIAAGCRLSGYRSQSISALL